MLHLFIFFMFSLFSFAGILTDGPWKIFADDEKKVIKFNDLSFTPPGETICQEKNAQELECINKNFSIAIKKSVFKRGTSLGLLRLNRKDDLDKQLKIFGFEETIEKFGFGQVVLQSMIFYEFNNITKAMLLRVFDRILNDGICITIVEKINLKAWPNLKGQINDFEFSLKYQK